MKGKSKIFAFLICVFYFWFFIFGFESSYAQSQVTTKEYDGLWFLGFNMTKDIFGNKNGRLVRQAFNYAIDRERIAKKIIGDDVVPTGVIPSSMLGYDPKLSPYEHNVSKAKKLMKEAGYPLNDRRLKNLTLLHTDGQKTIEIAKWIKRDLINLGVDLELKEVKYEDEAKWVAELKAGRYYMFLMGYKATPLSVLIGTSEAQKIDTSLLLRPLFHSKGEANFTFYKNLRVDTLLDQLDLIDVSLPASREPKLKEIAKILQDDPVTVNLFYITKL